MQGRIWRSILRRIGSGIFASIGLLLVAVVIIGVCIQRQATHSDVRISEGLLVIDAAQSTDPLSQAFQSRLDVAIDLQKRGYTRRIFIASSSETKTPAHDYLLHHGIDPAAIVTLQADNDVSQQFDALRSLTDTLKLRSVLIIADPPMMLRTLKIAQDRHLTVYPVPVGDQASVREIVDETWRYLGYVLFNR